jgi:hypothetical protein
VSRGTILRLYHWEAVQRALSMIVAVPIPPAGSPSDAGNRPINYRLEDYNGGDDPRAPHCASWSYGNRTPTADCIGFVLWASGVDRKQPGYSGSRGEWLNCAALCDDADLSVKGPQFCRNLARFEKALPGDWVLTRDHIAMLVRPDTTDSDPLVVDCSPRHGRKNSINTGGFWSETCRIVRPLVYGGAQ